jgi:hypothetical protein
LDVYLENGYHIHKTAYGNGVSIERFEALHKAIGLWLTEQPHPLRLGNSAQVPTYSPSSGDHATR